MNVSPFFYDESSQVTFVVLYLHLVSLFTCTQFLLRQEKKGKQAFRHNVSVSFSGTVWKASNFFYEKNKLTKGWIRKRKHFFFLWIMISIEITEKWVNYLCWRSRTHQFFFPLVSRETSTKLTIRSVFPFFRELYHKNKNKWKPILLLSEDAFGVKIKFRIDFFLPLSSFPQFVTDILWDFMYFSGVKKKVFSLC